MVPKARKLFGKPFRTERGVKQGCPVSPKIFVVVVYAVVREVLMEVCKPQEAQHVFFWAAGKNNIVFYADDG